MPTITQRFTRGVIKALRVNKNTQKKFNQGRNKRRQQKQDQRNRNEESKSRTVTPIYEYKLKF